VLLPKKNEPSDAKDFRPVSLMHSVAKILCKLLANRLAPELKNLVSASQSAFIKGRSIQDNFLYVKNVIKRAHKKKAPLIFLKLDISKGL
jgi:mannosylglycoprotein endo-beta-mannosidase